MGMPVKLSDELVLAARMEAEATDRTITAQIEHWAKLGRAAEAQLSYGEVVKLKLAEAPAARRTRAKAPAKAPNVRERLQAVAQSSDRSSVLEALQAQGKPIYEADPEHPGFVVRIEPDGKRILGRFEGRQFVSYQSAARRRKVAAR